MHTPTNDVLSVSIPDCAG